MLRPVDLSDPLAPISDDVTFINLVAAKNEWVSFSLKASGIQKFDARRPISLRVGALIKTDASTSIPVSLLSAFQVLPIPVDVNRASFVRHTGLTVSDQRLPRAMLPVPVNDGLVNLAALRSPSDPTRPDAHPLAGEATDLWFELRIPAQTPPGEYAARCELLAPNKRDVLSSVDLRLTVFDFVLPDKRHLVMVSQIEWASLARHFPDRFEAITTRLINRTEPRYEPAVRTIDQLIRLAQAHRADVVVPRLQPTVKWPSGQPPQIDWSDFDSLVGPWLNGDAFADKVPLGFWPLPQDEFLDRFDRASQLQYWSSAAAHFDSQGWLNSSAAVIEKRSPGRAGTADAIALSVAASQILGTHPRIRVSVPLEDDQIQISTDGGPGVDPTTTSRLLTAAPGIVFAPPIQAWPTGVDRADRWLRTDLPGLVPYVGAGGDERDVRLWAWLAFLRRSGVIVWDDALPKTQRPQESADPSQLVWFYPGAWFGVDEPVATLQLKWVRRAQQDFEYLYLAKERREVLNALVMARLITKPIEIQAFQNPDPTSSLMSGTTNPQVWVDAQRLLARTILLAEPGQEVDPARRMKLNLETLQWVYPQERPMLMGRNTQWLIDALPAPGRASAVGFVALRLGIDIYNASDRTPDRNDLAWTAAPPGWRYAPQPLDVPGLSQFHVRRFVLDSRFDLARAERGTHSPLEVTFTDGFTKEQSKLKLVLPVSATERREGLLKLDGVLNEWNPADAIQDGPLVKMLDRPTLQQQTISPAGTTSHIYSGWGEDQFYLAFKLAGVRGSEGASTPTRNFIDYQSRRAWGEDLAQILVQPIYADNSVGPVLHVACKTNGSVWAERKLDPKLNADPWQPFEGTGTRFASNVDARAGVWQGELAIPWKALGDARRGRPVLLRFNFTQHKDFTGESSSWAGPLDFGRDDAFMGLLHVREADRPGM